MQQTCRACNNLIPPGATTCSYCGTPVSSAPYTQQSFPPPPGTQYNTYTQPTASTSDPYAAQYNQPQYNQPAPPVAPTFGAPTFSGPPAQTGGWQQQPPSFFQQPPPQPRRSSSALIGIILVVVIVLGGLGAGAFFLLRKGNTANTPTATATASPTANASLYQTNLTQQTNDWDCGDATCTFNPDGYHITAPDDFVYKSILTKQSFTDTVIEVKGIISQGDPNNGGLAVAFRTPEGNTQAGYAFLLFGDGTYAVVRWNDQGKATEIVPESTDGSIHKGLGQQNTFKIIVTGTEFTFYVNNQKVRQVADGTYPQGYLALGATGKGTVAIFSDLSVTKPAS